MNPLTFLPAAEQLFPDEVKLFYRARNAVGSSLNVQGQEFLTKNWRHLIDFMETPAGQQAIATFLNTWGQSVLPPPPLGAHEEPKPE